jgi:ubiquinone/menaquinone biosynthesis C-methylase UbiE
MFKKFFQRLKFKMMAKQLRRPSGVMGGKVGSMMNKANEFLYDFTLDVMQPLKNDSILEIGFGNGKFFDKIFSKTEGLKVTGLDFSETMFKAASENNKETIASGKLTLHFGSSDKLPFPDNSFDKVFCINVIYFWDEPKQHLQEMFRVLKPGGQFYTTVRTKESMLKMPFTKYGFLFYNTDNWKALLAETGLTFIEEKPADEPVIEFDGNKLLVESLCVVAEKKY